MNFIQGGLCEKYACKRIGNAHILRNPVPLPCGNNNFACRDCFQGRVDFTCCGQHVNDNKDNLQINDAIQKEISENSLGMIEEIMVEMRRSGRLTEDDITKIEEQVGAFHKQVAKNAKRSIDRINELRDQLLTQFTTISTRARNELNLLSTELINKRVIFQKDADTLGLLLKPHKGKENTHDIEQSILDELIKSVYLCQDHIEDLRRMDENCQKILRKVTFQPSTWRPDISCLGPINFDINNNNNNNNV